MKFYLRHAMRGEHSSQRQVHLQVIFIFNPTYWFEFSVCVSRTQWPTCNSSPHHIRHNAIKRSIQGTENKINNHITDWGQVWPPIVIYTYLQIHISYKYQLNSWIRCVSFSICNIRKISICYQYDDLLLFIWIWLSE